MPIDIVKIDRGFIEGAMRDARGRSLFVSIAGLVRALGFHCVVEGVETPEQGALATVEGCETAQGWLYARPLEAAALSPWLVEHAADGVG